MALLLDILLMLPFAIVGAWALGNAVWAFGAAIRGEEFP